MRPTACYLSSVTVMLFALLNCQGTIDNYSAENYYQENIRDSLLVNIVTYTGRKPRYADHESRHNPEHRKFYAEQAKLHRFVFYHISEDSIHYFYIIRPARSTRGNLRGVGGRFRMSNNLDLYDFEELFNTPVYEEPELIKKGETLFFEMIISGNIEKYSGDRQYVEWPDERLRYDKVKNEWRYDVTE